MATGAAVERTRYFPSSSVKRETFRPVTVSGHWGGRRRQRRAGAAGVRLCPPLRLSQVKGRIGVLAAWRRSANRISQAPRGRPHSLVRTASLIILLEMSFLDFTCGLQAGIVISWR